MDDIFITTTVVKVFIEYSQTELENIIGVQAMLSLGCGALFLVFFQRFVSDSALSDFVRGMTILMLKKLWKFLSIN